MNLNFRGYNKTSDVRFALTPDELLIEVKYPSATGKLSVHRICKTLQKEVDVSQSSIELLVDFIAIRLRKKERDVAWDSLGYDISEFTIPKAGDMKSNFLTIPKPVPIEKPNA